MEKDLRSYSSVHRVFQRGDIVRHDRYYSSKKEAKSKPSHSERMVVVDIESYGKHWLQTLGDSQADLKDFHPDDMTLEKETTQEERDAALTQANETLMQVTEYEVEEVTDEQYTGEDKEFLVKFVGFPNAEWTHHSGLKGTQALLDYRASKKGKPVKKCSPKPVASVRSTADSATFNIDLRTALKGDISDLLRRIGVKPERVLMLFAGFPCETYSYCGHCNLGRGNGHGYNFRQSQAQGAPCCTDPGCKYSRKAMEHDEMLQDLKAALTRLATEHGTKFAIENPVDEMKNLPFMQTDTWEVPEGCHLVQFDNCAYMPRHRCKKPEMVFTNLQQYSPTGTTGNGRCNNGECKQGFWKDKHFRHFGQLGRHPSLGPRGTGAAKLKNELPTMWMQEFLDQSIKETDGDRNVFIDLFAGWQSWKPICEQFGIQYIAIDLLGDRNEQMCE